MLREENVFWIQTDPPSRSCSPIDELEDSGNSPSACNPQVHPLDSRNIGHTHFLGYWVGLTEKRYTSRPETFTSGRSTCKVGTWQVSGNLHIPKTGKSRMLFGRQRFSPSLNQKDCSIILFGQLPVEAPQNH